MLVKLTQGVIVKRGDRDAKRNRERNTKGENSKEHDGEGEKKIKKISLKQSSDLIFVILF
jgi:hypothetical protein